MARRSSRLKGSTVVEEAKRKLREKVEERKRKASRKKRSKTPTRKKRKKTSESEKFLNKADVLIEEIVLEPCRLGKDSFGWRMSQGVEMEGGDSWKMSASAQVQNSVFTDTLWFMDNAETLNIRVEAEPTVFKGTEFYGWSCETILTIDVDGEELRVKLYFDLINSAEYDIERVEDDLTPMDEDESDEDEEEEEFEGDVVRYLNKKDGWGMEGEESEEEEEEESNITKKTGGWASCPMSFLTSKYFVLFVIVVFLLKNEFGMAVLEDAVSFLVSFLEFLGVFVKKNLLG